MEGQRPDPEPHLTPWQRLAQRRLLASAGKRPGEPLAPQDWEAYFRQHMSVRAGVRLLSALPRSPRCGICGAPFAGIGARLVGPLGYRPSRKNPYICASCVELSPPGGMTMEIGILFADVRGFTALAETIEPHEASALLRRFYACAEDVLFPDALVDKLIGDQVMALYIPAFGMVREPSRAMLDHARALLVRVGYGGAGGPFAEIGIGLDFGEAFVGNIGDRWLYDFTAVGDVVNTASRLQEHARGGEIVVSDRLAATLGGVGGERVELSAKGKTEPVVAHRIAGSAATRSPA